MESHSEECKNCGHVYQGNFCPECGQSSKDLNRPLSVLIYDLVGTLFAFDTRLLNTTKTVFIQPGRYPEDLLDGRRAKHVPPFRLFVFASFIFFLLLSIRGNQIIDDSDFENSELPVQTTNDSIARIDSIQLDSAYLEIAADSISFNVGNEPMGAKLVKEEIRKSLREENLSRSQQVFYRRVLRVLDYPELFFSKFVRYLSWSFFLLMPFYAFLLWLVFRKKRRLYIGHLIFSLSVHTFLFAVFAVIVLIQLVVSWELQPEWYLLLTIPVYFWLASKRFYHESNFKLILKSLFLTVSYLTTVLVSTILILYLSLVY
ncbi:DUF3667 domain-containing protein [bacterium SCSIO 12741]|nr:DUF3667 domain-containing protein [bacterium SCSIO 12741]